LLKPGEDGDKSLIPRVTLDFDFTNDVEGCKSGDLFTGL